MTTALITLYDLQTWVFSTQPENDRLLEQIATLATGIVLDYVGPDPVTLLARDWTEATVPDPVRAAILHVAAEMWAHRGDAAPADLTKDSSLGRLNPLAERLLVRWRDQVVA